MPTLKIRSDRQKQVLDLTDRINGLITEYKLETGICSLFLLHTTAALTTGEVGEGTEADLLEVVEQMIPRIRFRHAHDPGHAWTHMAASILGPSLHLSVEDGRLVLGTWQSVLLVELDGPRQRTIQINLIPT